MKKEIKKLDLTFKAYKTRLYLLPLIWIAVFFSLLFKKYKINKENFKRIKGGCLVLSNHQSFEDVKFLEKVIFPRRANYIVSVDEFMDKEWILRKVGCIPKKVHYNDFSIVRNMVRLLKEGRVLVIYPEATYSFAGVNNIIDQSLGKMAKLANFPVIVINEKGNYLYSPRWNTLPKNKEVPVQINAKMVVSKDEISLISADEIQKRINEYFIYDEYKYQRESNIHIKNKTMAHNIDRILYICPNCKKELGIKGEGNNILCSNCNAKYEIDELSILKNVNGETKFDSISNWYLWQKEVVKESVEKGNYNLEFKVKISRYLNTKLGFDHHYAKGIAKANEKGIIIDGIINETNEPFHYEYDARAYHTIHLTYDVKGCQESAFEVHSANESYLIYPIDGTPIVKIRFGIECGFEKNAKELNKR